MQKGRKAVSLILSALCFENLLDDLPSYPSWLRLGCLASVVTPVSDAGVHGAVLQPADGPRVSVLLRKLDPRDGPMREETPTWMIVAMMRTGPKR
jgi:hypothetical protein